MPTDPLAQFKLKLNKSHPPETWAHGLDALKVTKPSMTSEKVAFFDPVSLATSLAGHVVPNWGYMGYRNSRWGKNTEENQMALGIQHALQGRTIEPGFREYLQNHMGPEFLASYEAGHQLGNVAGGRNELERMARMKTVGSVLEGLPHLSKAPIARSAPAAIQRVLEGSGGKGLDLWRFLPTSEVGAKRGLLSRVLPTVATAGTAAAALASGNPWVAHGALGTLGSNAVRRLMTYKPPGFSQSPAEWFTARSLKSGFTDQAPTTMFGRAGRALKNFTMGSLVSPAAGDPHAIGQAMGKDYDAVIAPKINAAANKMGFKGNVAPSRSAVANFADNVHKRVLAGKATPAAAPAQGMGGLGKALLLGGGLYALNQAMNPPQEKRRREAPPPGYGYGMVNQY